MRMRQTIALLVMVLAALPAQAQEIRGNINGIVQDKSGVIPGAAVTVRNAETGQTQPLVTNARGYFEALLLNPGTYSVDVQVNGFKGYKQTNVAVAVGQTVSLTITLEVGQITEEVTVVAQSPILDTTTVSSGQNFDRRMVEGLPMFSNMPIMLSRFAPGVVPGTAEAEVINVFQGYMEGTTAAAGGQLGTGSGFDSRNTGNNYTIDGAQNNGFGRRLASSPNSDQIEEVRIETSNFDASQGHGTGLSVSMMTRAGTNTLRGSANYTHWHNRLNSPNLQQKVTFKQDPGSKRPGARGANTSAPSRSADRWSSRRSSTAATRRSFSETSRCPTTPRQDVWPATRRCPPTRNTSTAISPICCCCRQVPGQTRRRATISIRSSIP